MLDVADQALLWPINDAAGVVEVVGGGGERIDLELVDVFLGDVIDKPVDDEGALYPALAVQDQDNFVALRVFEGAFNEGIAVLCFLGLVDEVTPDKALDEIEYNPIAEDVMMVSAVDVLWDIGNTDIRWIVDTEDLASECFSQ